MTDFKILWSQCSGALGISFTASLFWAPCLNIPDQRHGGVYVVCDGCNSDMVWNGIPVECSTVIPECQNLTGHWVLSLWEYECLDSKETNGFWPSFSNIALTAVMWHGYNMINVILKATAESFRWLLMTWCLFNVCSLLIHVFGMVKHMITEASLLIKLNMTHRDSPTIWCLCACFHIMLQFMCPSM